MHPFEITELWRRLALPDPDFAETLVDAMQAARKPHGSVHDCPWEPSLDPEFRKRRIAWRVAFRLTREHNAVKFGPVHERRAA